jgi:hypothetical protein
MSQQCNRNRGCNSWLAAPLLPCLCHGCCGREAAAAVIRCRNQKRIAVVIHVAVVRRGIRRLFHGSDVGDGSFVEGRASNRPSPTTEPPPSSSSSSCLHQLQVPPTTSVDARVTFGPNKVRNSNIQYSKAVIIITSTHARSPRSLHCAIVINAALRAARWCCRCHLRTMACIFKD